MRIVPFLIFLMTLYGCNQENNKSSFPRLSSELEITKQPFIDENVADSMKFIMASKLQTDSTGNVYVFDRGQMDIKIFDKEGNPKQIIGKRGRGPGEFISNSGFFVYRDSIYAFDQDLKRLSVFSLKGELATTHELKVSTHLILKPMGETGHLGIYTDYFGPKLRLDINFAREFASDFSVGGSPFMQLSGLVPEFEGITDLLTVKVGDVLKTDENKFLYVPFFYSGELFHFEKGDNQWEHTNTYDGYTELNPYSQVSDGSKRHPDVKLMTIRLKSPLKYVIHNQSRGLLKYKNKIYHFTQCEFDDGGEERVFGVEIYNENMKPLGYMPIKTIPIRNKPGNTTGWHAEGVDDEGNIYIRELKGGKSNIWLLEFNWGS